MTAAVTTQSNGEERSSSLFDSLLGGLLGEPVCGSQLGQAGHRPSALNPLDDIDQVFVGFNPQNEAIVDKGVVNGEPFAATHGAGEEKGASAQGVISNSPFSTSVVNFESTVCEAASEKCSLVDSVGRRSSQRRFGQQLRVNFIHPAIKHVEDGKRASLPFSKLLTYSLLVA